VKKIKLVDDTYNTNKYSPFQKFPYLTVFFYSVKIEDLPNPRFIGDLLYLRRYYSINIDFRLDTITKVSKVTISKQNTVLGLW